MTTPTRSLLLGFSLPGLTALSLQAGQKSNSDCPPDAVQSRPVPIKVVPPAVDPEQVGQVVTLRFTVDEQGKPQEIASANPWPADPVLVARMIQAVRSWEFQPALDERGRPVAMTVELPIVVGQMARS